MLCQINSFVVSLLPFGSGRKTLFACLEQSIFPGNARPLQQRMRWSFRILSRFTMVYEDTFSSPAVNAYIT